MKYTTLILTNISTFVGRGWISGCVSCLCTLTMYHKLMYCTDTLTFVVLQLMLSGLVLSLTHTVSLGSGCQVGPWMNMNGRPASPVDTQASDVCSSTKALATKVLISSVGRSIHSCVNTSLPSTQEAATTTIKNKDSSFLTSRGDNILVQSWTVQVPKYF